MAPAEWMLIMCATNMGCNYTQSFLNNFISLQHNEKRQSPKI